MGYHRIGKALPFAALLALVLVGCADTNSGSKPGKSMETTVSLKQMDAVARDVQQWHDMQYPKCKFDAVVSTKVTRQDKDSADEVWTIRGCEGQTFSYGVNVIHFPGGISDVTFNLDGRPVQVH